MKEGTIDRLTIGVGVVALLAGPLVLLALPAANRIEETTFATIGVAVLLLVVGARTILDVVRG